MQLYGLCDFLEIKTQFLGLDHKLFYFLLEEIPALGGVDGERSLTNVPRTDLEDAFRNQLPDDFMRSIRIDLEGFAQRANGREWLSRNHLA